MFHVKQWRKKMTHTVNVTLQDDEWIALKKLQNEENDELKKQGKRFEISKSSILGSMIRREMIRRKML